MAARSETKVVDSNHKGAGRPAGSEPEEGFPDEAHSPATSHRHSKLRSGVAVFFCAAIVPAAITLALARIFGGTEVVHEPMHQLLELAGSFTAAGVAALLLLQVRYTPGASHFLWVAAALLGMGVIDALHGIAKFGLAWSWLRHVATLVGGLLFAAVWLPVPEWIRRGRATFPFLIALGSAALGWAIWMHADRLPAPWTVGGYAWQVKAVNATGGCGFLVATIYFLRRYWRRHERTELVFASHTLLFGAAGLLFGFSHVWQPDWWTWHVFRLLAYLIVGSSVYQSISEMYRRQAEQTERLKGRVQLRARELRASEHRNASLLDTALDAIVLMDHHGNVVEFNPSAEKIFGYRREQLIGKPMADFIIPVRFRERHNQGLARYLATGEGPVLGKRIEMPALRADGTEIPVELSIVRVPGITPPVFVGTMRDITERQAAEAAVKAARDALEETNAKLESTVQQRTAALRETIEQLETFSYSITHDMRGPLRTMTSFAHLIEEEAAAKLNEEQKDYLRRIMDGARRLDQLIQDVLQYSKLSREALNLETVNLERVVRDILREYPDLAQRADCFQVETHCADTAVRANVSALTQVVSNLLTNALKFVPPTRKPEVRITCEERGERIRLTISDNGVGIPEEQHGRIFGVFQRLHGPEIPGTGIGLSIVKKAVERMGGTVGLDSKVGVGSNFWIELPRAAAEKKPAIKDGGPKNARLVPEP